MSEPLETDPPLLNKDDPDRLSSSALRLSLRTPHHFLLYLRRVWNTNKQQILGSANLQRQLGDIEVLCLDECFYPLSETWFPSQKLLQTWSSYLFLEDPFHVLKLSHLTPNVGDRRSWDFLKEIGCQHELGHKFFTELLLIIKRSHSMTGDWPQRVANIYVDLQRSRCPHESSSASIRCSSLADDKLLRDKFHAEKLLLHNGDWVQPNSCFRYAPDYVRSRRVLMPLKAFCLTKLIAVEHDGHIKWLHIYQCIWSPVMETMNRVDLSRRYPDLKGFFVNILGVEEATVENIHSRLTYMRSSTSDAEIRDLFGYLNGLVAKSQILLEPVEILRRRVFPAKFNGKKYRVTGFAEDLLIPDHQQLATTFKDKVSLLDFTPEEVVLLDPMFTWLGLKDRYLSQNIYHRSIHPANAKKEKVEWDVAQRAEGILRIALYCGSPRTTTQEDRGNLLKLLKEGEMLAVEGLRSESLLLSDSPGSYCLGSAFKHACGFAVPSTEPKLSIGFDDSGRAVDRFVVRVSMAKEEQELACFTIFPRFLMAWLMTDPRTGRQGEITVLGMSLMKSVLTAPPHVIDAVLTQEGVGRIQMIDKVINSAPQEAKPPNTASTKHADEPSKNKYDPNMCQNLLHETYKNRSEESSPANTSTKKSERPLEKHPANAVPGNKQSEPVAEPNKPRTATKPTREDQQPQSTPEPSPKTPKMSPQDGTVAFRGSGRQKPLYAFTGQRPKLKPKSRRRFGSPSSNLAMSSPSSQIPEDMIRGIEQPKLEDACKAVVQPPKPIPVA
ncbi:hypothetical protein IL306_007907 [Fusarium sp. DS 682]|nr:hypothetical protein IL306_007907 [Fusarium sp. DS 682]